MPKQISRELESVIKRLLLSGLTVPQVLDAIDGEVSERKIRAIKKDLPKIEKVGPDIQDNYNTNLTKKEQSIAQYYKDYKQYEDAYEGWVFHMEANLLRQQKSSLWWWGIAYPDSAPKDWIEQLEYLNLQTAISPLHDKDTWTHDSPEVKDKDGNIIEEEGSRYKAGDPKKEHWHFIIKCERKVSFEEINKAIRKITNGPYLQKVFTLRGTYDYLSHKNKTNKFQYDEDEIQHLNGFVIEANDYEKKVLLQEIFTVIKEKNFTTFKQLADYFIEDTECISIIANKAFALQSVIKDNWREEQKKKEVARASIIARALGDVENTEQNKLALQYFFKHKNSYIFNELLVEQAEDVEELQELIEEEREQNQEQNIIVYDDFEEETNNE